MNLQIYDIVKITDDRGSVYIESINSINNEYNYYTTNNFTIPHEGGDAIFTFSNCGHRFHIDTVWRLSENGDYKKI